MQTIAQSGHPGVDGMMKIFCDFRLFSAFFFKPMLCSKFGKNSSTYIVPKQPFFAFFWQKYFENPSEYVSTI
jgi:hypothetical protein